MEDIVAIDDVELDRVGEPGRIEKCGGCDGAGEGAAAGTGVAFARDGDVIGTGVPWADGVGAEGVGPDAALEFAFGCDSVGTGPEYLSPSSPGANASVEQKPSVEVISNVRPSLDLFVLALISDRYTMIHTKSGLRKSHSASC